MTEFDDTTPLGVARQWLRDQVNGKGARCPCCTQLAKVYKRGINATQAHMLIRAWRTVGQADFRRVEVFPGEPEADFAKLRFWALIIDLHERRPDGGPAGWYRITDDGVRWIKGELAVPARVRLYDGTFQGYDREAPPWTIRDALGTAFNYDELMGMDGTD